MNKRKAKPKADWSWVTPEMEYEALGDILDEVGVDGIMGIGDVYTILREHFNNEVLERLADEHGRDRETGLPVEEE
jgi:hypothetical protein